MNEATQATQTSGRKW